MNVYLPPEKHIERTIEMLTRDIQMGMGDNIGMMLLFVESISNLFRYRLAQKKLEGSITAEFVKGAEDTINTLQSLIDEWEKNNGP